MDKSNGSEENHSEKDNNKSVDNNVSANYSSSNKYFESESENEEEEDEEEEEEENNKKNEQKDEDDDEEKNKNGKYKNISFGKISEKNDDTNNVKTPRLANKSINEEEDDKETKGSKENKERQNSKNKDDNENEEENENDDDSIDKDSDINDDYQENKKKININEKKINENTKKNTKKEENDSEKSKEIILNITDEGNLSEEDDNDDDNENDKDEEFDYHFDENNNYCKLRTHKKYKSKKIKGCSMSDFAIIFLKIMLHDNQDISVIFNRSKYKAILDNIEKNKNYFELFKNIEAKDYNNPNLFELLQDNKSFLNKPLLIVTLNPNQMIEVEFYKFGKTFTKSIRKRHGITINNNFYSSTVPLEQFDEKKAKNKTKYILNSKEIILENYEGNENNYNKNNIWHSEDKIYRIRINYMTDKNKMSSFFVYSPDEKERNEIFQLIKLTQMSLNIKGPANSCLNGMKKILFKNDQFYVIAKILAVKRKCKNKIKLRKYLNKNILEKDKKKFNEFKNEIKNKIKLKYIEQRKFFYNKGINRDMKQLLLHSKFIKKKVVIILMKIAI